jgi:hypothetical protein
LLLLVVLILVRHFGLELAPRVHPTFAPPEACTQLGQPRAIHGGASAAQEHWPEPKSYKADKACSAAFKFKEIKEVKYGIRTEEKYSLEHVQVSKVERTSKTARLEVVKSWT